MEHKILIVESDPPGGSRVVRALRTAGFRVVAPASPATTLATFDRVRPDLVLIGGSLPDDGGAALCRELKKTQHGSRTPVALLVENLEIDLQPFAELGWDRLIESATGDQDLVEICRELTRSRGTPGVAPPDLPEKPVAADRESQSLEDAIDQVLTFDHEESVAHIQQRPSVRPADTEPIKPATCKPAPAPAAKPAAAAPTPVARPERPRFQTAALVESKPVASETAPREPEPQAAVSSYRRWWMGGAVAAATVLIVVIAWLGFSGGDSPGPQAPTAISNASLTPALVPAPGAPDEPSTVAASAVSVVSEPEPEPPAEETKPRPAPAVAKAEKPEPPVAKTKPRPAPVVAKVEKPEPKPEPEPPAEEANPLPAPAVAKVEKLEPKPEPEAPVVETPRESKQPAPKPAEPEPEPPATEPQTPAEPEKPAEAEEAAAPEPEPAPPSKPMPAPLVEPVLLEKVDPAPSPKAVKRNRGASIVLRLLVNERGNVIRVVVAQGITGSELEAAAVNAVLRWKYRPASRDGQPVQAWTEARFTFD